MSEIIYIHPSFFFEIVFKKSHFDEIRDIFLKWLVKVSVKYFLINLKII